jgi:hypothetical protein
VSVFTLSSVPALDDLPQPVQSAHAHARADDAIELLRRAIALDLARRRVPGPSTPA